MVQVLDKCSGVEFANGSGTKWSIGSTHGQGKKKTTSILLASSTKSPKFHAFSTPVRVPRSYSFSLHGWNIRYRHQFASSVGAGSREGMEGPFMWEGDCWWEETRA